MVYSVLGTILGIVFSLLSLFGFSQIVSGIVTRRLNKKAKLKEDKLEEEKAECLEQVRLNNLNAKANKILLRNIIYQICNDTKRRKYMWLYELEQLNEAMEVYEGLDGNGSAHKIYADTIAGYKVVTDPSELSNEEQ